MYPIDWSNQKCCLCNFKLDVAPTSFDTSNDKMTYVDFYICYEHKLLRNIYSKHDLQKSEGIDTLKNYYNVYKKKLRLCTSLQNVLHTHSMEDLPDETRDFLEDCCNFQTIDDLKEQTELIEIKNLIKSKIPKSALQTYAFVYQNLFDFPRTQFDFETITTSNFFRNLHCLIKVKVHLHHSHVTGEIYGYVHDFCNWSVRENKTKLSVIAYNFSGFDAFFFFKCFQATTWGTRDINIGSNNLTNINYVNINDGEVKFIDTLKFYQQSLASLTATLTDQEKTLVKKITEKFLNSRDYFSEIWSYLSRLQREKSLDIVASGKGVIPYEKIVSLNSLDLKPENGSFLEKNEFFSELKNTAVLDDDYENSKYLYQNLKMRNLSDLNDLYNFQDVVLLREIVENRFHVMQDEYGYNPRKCNSASTLSGCIEREMSKVIIALPTSNEFVNTFEETLTGGFSSVNTRLAFDTQILLPNLVDCKGENNILKKDYNYKIC